MLSVALFLVIFFRMQVLESMHKKYRSFGDDFISYHTCIAAETIHRVKYFWIPVIRDKKRESNTRCSWKLSGKFSELAAGYADKWGDCDKGVGGLERRSRGGAVRQVPWRRPQAATQFPRGKEWFYLVEEELECHCNFPRCLLKSSREPLNVLSWAEV